MRKSAEADLQWLGDFVASHLRVTEMSQRSPPLV